MCQITHKAGVTFNVFVDGKLTHSNARKVRTVEATAGCYKDSEVTVQIVSVRDGQCTHSPMRSLADFMVGVPTLSTNLVSV